ncbi:MAG: zinc-binding dehydrogenase [Candidatus Alectryocaccobium sp.]|nr:zinc-binding dehydrogenase [Candidatus Alectryocaccobium sp.]
MKTTAARMYGPRDLRIEEIELPELKPNQILVKLGACGICGSDLSCFTGDNNEGRYDLGAYTPGHEWAGKAVAIGSAVTSIAVGNKVVGDCLCPCYRCANCKDGKMAAVCENFDEVGFLPTSYGGMAYYMITQEEYTHVIPDEWSYELGALVENFNVGYWGAWGNKFDPDAQDICVIIGAGTIGLTAAMSCAASMATVIVCDIADFRLEQAKKFGADYVINSSKCDVAAEVRRLTKSSGATIVIEASGSDAGIASAFEIAAPGGKIAAIGHSHERMVPVKWERVIWKNLTIKGAAGTQNWFPRTIRFMSKIKSKYNIEGLVSHKFNFKDLHEAFDFALNNKSTTQKVMLTFDED